MPYGDNSVQVGMNLEGSSHDNFKASFITFPKRTEKSPFEAGFSTFSQLGATFSLFIDA